jgi:hypothetical protein
MFCAARKYVSVHRACGGIASDAPSLWGAMAMVQRGLLKAVLQITAQPVSGGAVNFQDRRRSPWA